MNNFNLIFGGLAAIFSVSCGGLTTVPLTERSSTFTSATALTTAQATAPTPASTPAPTPVVLVSADIYDPATARPVSRLVVGTAGPLREGAEPCFADHYPCEVYNFSLLREGPIEVEVTWDGPPRLLLVQLYWAGEGLAHEDVAPRDGPSRIYFRRPRMEATDYTLRIVNLDPTHGTPFALRLAY
jgi:hypothetical protein